VQIGAAFGSLLGRFTKVTEGRVRLLVACGAAGGVAATFDTPLAGALFAMELILGERSISVFCATALAGAAGAAIGRIAFGGMPFLGVPPFHADHINQYLLLGVLGLASGVVGAGFTRVLYVEDGCNWAWRGPEWLRPVAGGTLLDLLLLALPEMYGTGYPVLEKAAEGGCVAGFLLLLLAGKILTTSLTFGVGGAGGVFAPTLFIRTTLGAAYGTTMQHLLPNASGAVASYALVGMGAVFAATSGTPSRPWCSCSNSPASSRSFCRWLRPWPSRFSPPAAVAGHDPYPQAAPPRHRPHDAKRALHTSQADAYDLTPRPTPPASTELTQTARLPRPSPNGISGGHRKLLHSPLHCAMLLCGEGPVGGRPLRGSSALAR
jgi:hypothetical protein